MIDEINEINHIENGLVKMCL